MQYNRNKPPASRQLESELQLQAIWQELEQLRRIRAPEADLHRDIRWAITDGSVYPNTDANTFAIRFLDAHFTRSVGLRSFVATPRSSDVVTVAHAATGQYIPTELPLPVFWQRGLGGEGKGEWWFLDPPRLYVGNLTTVLSKGGSATMEIYLPDSLLELQASGCTITVHDVLFGLAGQQLPVGTRIIALWYLAPNPMWIVAALPPTRLARAKLQYDLCGTTPATITDFEFLGGGTLAAPPTSAWNLYKHRGMANDWLCLAETTLHASGWLIIDVEKHAHKVFTDLRQTGGCDYWCVEGYAVTAALEICAPPAWETIYCNPCYDIQTSFQSSQTQSSHSTSVPAHDCCGLANGVAPSNVLVTITDGTAPCLPSPIPEDPNSFYLVARDGRTNDTEFPTRIYTYNIVNNGGFSALYEALWEEWSISCDYIRDISTRVRLYPDDPTKKEWVVSGQVQRSSAGGSALRFELREFSQRGIVSPGGGVVLDLTDVEVNVYSCSPFHAIARFHCYINNESWHVTYPLTYNENDCGVTTLEFTE